ncbi:MAG TPA: hypothetical protein VL461_11920 [Dictyobacter sp.]|jgi:hypothetical protein|nr:hypothetical protein [Dictyobacter sp.]
MHTGGSEVAKLKEQIEHICQAMNQYISGYAVTARHDIINKKYTILGAYQEQLGLLIGEEQALDVVMETYNHLLN